ncbi:hypothetical protein [Aquifex aeolicus]|uniref:hypothetical protein n=1 Tax=Aquifex aeolicus TaxID=63363 RepID=UPI0002EA5A18|nr:hypothetical protein [Aquifex aeolicus]
MQFLKGDKAFNFLLGLIYGYRTADVDMKIRPLEEFKEEEYSDFTIYYIDRKSGEVKKGEKLSEYTHVVVLKEDHENKKVRIVIFKRLKN